MIMKKIKNRNSLFVTFLAAALVMLSLHSCDDDDNGCYEKMYPNAIVTVKTAADNTTYLQLDDNTTLYPENITKNPYGGKEVRALVNFTEKKDNASGYTKTVYVN